MIVFPAILLAAILALLCPSVQRAFEAAFRKRPVLIFVVPAALSAVFLFDAGMRGAFNLTLAGLILVYTFLPVICAHLVRDTAPPIWVDFLIIALLWFPLEFSIGQQFVLKQARNPLHLTAYGVSILLGLAIFLLFRRLPGMKYNLPRSTRDLTNLLVGFVLCAPVLIVLGRAIGFLPPFHRPAQSSVLHIGSQYLIILAATALPEEILFRALIQNAIAQRLGVNVWTLLLAAVIFGCAHLDNGPGPLPNWRYMILATIAGVAYGKVYEKSSSILASAGLHALVDLIKHLNF
ncbi:MAG TPA: type II CAAX endopeptidase family protein [Bryobacteraceae bacterium]|nr:type II CAAX endopeptidase family protein [Bryobacteraceae bacterium]